VRDRLTEREAASVLKLAAAAADEDGVAPLSEHVMLHLRHGGDPRARNLLLFEAPSESTAKATSKATAKATSEGAHLAGYAHLDPTDPVEGPSGELVIHPRFRRRGLGRTAVQALVAEAGGRPVRLWAHGDLPAADRLAASAGFERIRSLWQLRRSLDAPLDRPVFADAVLVRTFVPGRDEAAWTDLNRRAFAGHPEQGAWTRDDLEQREHEAWFDPDGFFLAERDGRLIGFHWTKIHGGRADRAHEGDREGHAHEGDREGHAHEGDREGHAHEGDREGHAHEGDREGHAHEGDREGHAHEPLGEVYVVGVDPAERGTGLGRALTLTGLWYLRSRGLEQVMLYVDESNTPAIRLYEALGFKHWGTDVMFRHPGAGAPAAHAPTRRVTP
jgi:mycothiol synthase